MSKWIRGKMQGKFWPWCRMKKIGPRSYLSVVGKIRWSRPASITRLGRCSLQSSISALMMPIASAAGRSKNGLSRRSGKRMHRKKVRRGGVQ